MLFVMSEPQIESDKHSLPNETSKKRLEKVTAFITRGPSEARELLVFRHPHGSVQLPAGTVEEGEPAAEAVLREVWEETGLIAVRIVSCLAAVPQSMRADERVVLRHVQMLQRPDPDAPAAIAGFASYLGLRRGLYVRLLDISDDGRYAQIAYEEFDGPAHLFTAPSRSVSGWVDADSVTDDIVRHHFHLATTEPAADSWIQTAEEWEHRFELYWIPLTGPNARITELLPFQAAWLEEYGRHIVTD